MRQERATASVAIVVPLKPGKSELLVDRSRALKRERKADVEKDLRRHGIHRSSSWLQRTPEGDLAILYWEVEDPAKLEERMRAIAAANDGFYAAIRESLSDIFDTGPGESPPSSELLIDYLAGAHASPESGSVASTKGNAT